MNKLLLLLLSLLIISFANAEEIDWYEIHLTESSSLYFDSDTVFPANVHLIIDAGLNIYLADTCTLIINGKLSVLGTKEHEVNFFSNKLTPAKIIINSKVKSRSFIKYTHFENVSIEIISSKIDITNSLFEFQETEFPIISLYVYKSDANIEQSTFKSKQANNIRAIYAERSNIDIFNCEFVNFNFAIELNALGSSNIVGNRILNSNHTAIKLRGCHEIQIFNNKILKANQIGIKLENSFFESKFIQTRDTYIRNNIIFKSDTGIFVDGAKYTTILRNKIDSSSCGIFLDNCTTAKILNNQLNSNIRSLNNRLSTNIVKKENIIQTDNRGKEIVYTGFKYEYIDPNKAKIKYLDNPIIKINTKANSVQFENKIPSKLQLFSKDSLLISSDISIEYRGSSSLAFTKRSYSFNTILNLKKKSISFLDLPESNKWVLYGPFLDRTGVRNAIVYTLANEIGILAPQFRFVNLFINERYNGLYLLMPKIKRNKSWLKVEKFSHYTDSIPSPALLFKLDKYNEKREGTEVYSSAYKWYIKYYLIYPKRKNMDQFDFFSIEEYLKHFESRIVDSNQLGLINQKSFVDYAILNELTKNIDAYRNSQYFYKKQGNDTILAGPLWDYNMSMGSYPWDKNNKPEGFVKDFPESFTKYFPSIWESILLNQEYKIAFKNRWEELRKAQLSDQKISILVNTLYQEVKNDISFEYKNNYKYYNTNTELENLTKWLKLRCNWIDNNIDKY